MHAFKRASSCSERRFALALGRAGGVAGVWARPGFGAEPLALDPWTPLEPGAVPVPGALDAAVLEPGTVFVVVTVGP
jgi:hypothetical protein